MKTIPEMCFVQQAAHAGQKIEISSLFIRMGHPIKEYHLCVKPEWDWPNCDYRIKLPDGWEYTGEFRQAVVGVECYLNANYEVISIFCPACAAC